VVVPSLLVVAAVYVLIQKNPTAAPTAVPPRATTVAKSTAVHPLGSAAVPMPIRQQLLLTADSQHRNRRQSLQVGVQWLQKAQSEAVDSISEKEDSGLFSISDDDEDNEDDNDDNRFYLNCSLSDSDDNGDPVKYIEI
jgi:hypothetical protein